MRMLYEAGYFTYQPLETPDYDQALKLLEPALLDLRHKIGSYGFAAGSGCIYRITPEYIYMLSVDHVMKSVHYQCDVMFFDGTVVRENIVYATSKQRNELSLFRIPVKDVPVDTLLKLRQVYVDPDIYSKLSKDDEVVAFAKHWLGKDKDLIRRMKVRRLTATIWSFGMVDSLLETTTGVVSGMSGTAVIDLRGNLVGLASAFGPATGNEKEASCFHSKIDVLTEVEAALEEKNRAA